MNETQSRDIARGAHMSKSSSSSDISPTSAMAAGRILRGCGGGDVPKARERPANPVRGRPPCSSEARFADPRIACFLRSDRGDGSADGDDGVATEAASIDDNVPKRLDDGGTLKAPAAVSAVKPVAGRAPLSC